MSIKEILQNSIVPITSTNIKNSAFGTGFVFWQEDNASYILTCAHVIEEIIGDNEKQGNICVGSVEQVEIIACGKSNYIDLAVLKVDNLPKQMLSSCNLHGQEDIDFQISGYYRDDGAKNPIIGKDIEGKTKSEITLTKSQLNGWDLSIDEKYKLQKGYSGSPIIDKRTKKVFAIATHAEGGGSGGYAVSIHNLLKIWGNAPNELHNILTKTTQEHKNLSNIDCQLLIGIRKSNNDNLYIVEAWIYPPQEFENIYVKNFDAKDIEDKTINSHQFITEILDKLDKRNVSHDKLTLEFMLPIELFSHHIEQWTNDDNKPIGTLYPILTRFQDRLLRKTLQRFWKPIQPELGHKLSNKLFWLETPEIDILDFMLEEGYVCFGLQFDIYNTEQNFLANILNCGASIGLLVRFCEDFSCINKKINKELFGKEDLFNLDEDKLLLKELPRALLRLRKKQRAYKNCDYHISLFWDDKDRVPTFKLEEPTNKL